MQSESICLLPCDLAKFLQKTGAKVTRILKKTTILTPLKTREKLKAENVVENNEKQKVGFQRPQRILETSEDFLGGK